MTPPLDPALESVATEILRADPDGNRIARVLRETLDQLYDGQRTGRFRWEQLHKTEKTHCGTLVEINLHREFGFDDGAILDYMIATHEVDCKYSQRLGGWMIPPEARDQICLLVWSDDTASVWSAGLVRPSATVLNTGGNRDQKSTLNADGRDSIRWLFDRAQLPPNVLLQLPPPVVEQIMSHRYGTARLNDLFRNTLGMRVGRGVVATVAQQYDYMKRVRANGGSRSALQPEGIVILGQYRHHVDIARRLGVAEPGPGESVPIRLARASVEEDAVEIEGRRWRVAVEGDPRVAAPSLE